jgi:hypothetical protein
MTINNYLEIIGLDKSLYKTNTEYLIDLVSIYYDIDPIEVEEWDMNKLIEKSNNIDLKLNNPADNSINIKSKTLYKLDFNRITLGEWIDLDYYINNKMWLEVITILYRLKRDGGDFEEDRWEEYGLWVDKRKNLFSDKDFRKYFNVVYEFIKWRDSVLRAYSGLFSVGDNDDDLDDLSDVDRRELEELKKKEDLYKQFIWERMIMELVNNDISKFDSVLKLPVIQIWNVLTMLKKIKK